MKTIYAQSIAAVGLALISVAPAQAGITYNGSIAAPGVYYGGGNTNGAFTINTVDGVELALRGHVYQQNPGTPVGNLYSFNLGDVISFDFSFNPGADGSPASLAGLTSLLTVTNVGTGGSFSIDPILIFDNAHNAGAPGGYQNSERLNFGFLNLPGGIGYNANTNATYQVSWTLSGTSIPAITNSIYLQQGTGAVPEPASWALMIVGFGVVGAAMRRRVSTVSFA